MQQRRGRWRDRVVAIVMILLGAVVSVFPVGENLYNDWRGVSVVEEYESLVSAVSPSVLDTQWQAANEYNASLTGSSLDDPWSDQQVAVSAEHDAYVGELAGLGPLGRVRVPAVGIDLPIYHDATSRSLNLGAGHMYGTSLPIGGVGTHSVIAGHTGATVRTYFNRLRDAVEGDVIILDSAGRTLTYRVDRIQVVDKSDLSQIQPVDGADLVTLVTCLTGRGDDRRLLVRGTRVTDDAAAETVPVVVVDGQHGTASVTDLISAEVKLGVQDWARPRLALGGAAVVLVLGMTVVWMITDARRARAADGQAVQGKRALT